MPDEHGWMEQIARRAGISRFALWVIRGEIEGLSVRLQNRVRPGFRRAIREIRAHRDLLVNVGCGPYILSDFINIDVRRFAPEVVVWDCRRSLPVADASCRGIRIEHFLEHVDPRDEVPALLDDCHRALQPGAVLRIVVPDAARFLFGYTSNERAAFDALGVPNPFPADLPSRLDVVNHTFHQWHEHRWAYDEESLTWRLRQAGFSRVTRQAFGESRLPPLATDRSEHAAYSLYVEALK